MTMTDGATSANTVLGKRRLRKEDPALLTGEAKYTNDLNIPGALHLAVLRSPYAHARILSVDVSATLAMPGVVAAYSGADLVPLWAGPMPCAWPVTADMKNPAHSPLAVAKAAYVATVRVQLAHAVRNFGGTPSGIVTLQRRDVTRDASLSFDWQPYNFMSVSASLQNARRTSSLAGFDYSANTVNLSAQFTY